MPSFDATIVAIATPPGEGGVGIVRLSGGDALSIARALFTPAKPGAELLSHRLVHGTIREPATRAVLDDCLVCYMAGPRTYTGEDVVELHCHGSPVLLQHVVGCCLQCGARAAERGEFTLRAFLNGRLDLAQAEAVINLVRARTATAVQVAAQGLTGALARRLEPVTQTITGVLAYLEATIDFVEEGLPEQAAPRLAAELDGTSQELTALLRRATHGAILRDGVRVVLAGRPNVGKSSLLNALLRRDRAIVTPVPGTTRDTLEEPADIHGLPMYLIDTAGITDTGDLVERIGVERARAAVETAALVVLIVEAGSAVSRDDVQAASAIRTVAQRAPMLLVMNKADLAPAARGEAFDLLFSADWRPREVIRCSALTGQGLAELEDALARMALGNEALDAEETLVETARQVQALREAEAALGKALEGLRTERIVELVCIDLRTALESLGSVTGMNVSEAVLDRIFSDFCIGK